MSRKRATSKTLMVMVQWLAVLPMLCWPAFAHSSCCCDGRSNVHSECRQLSSEGDNSIASNLEIAPSLPAACPHCVVDQRVSAETLRINASDADQAVDAVVSLRSDSIGAVCHCVIESPPMTTGVRAETTPSVYADFALNISTLPVDLQTASATNRGLVGRLFCCTSAERCAWNCRWLN